MIRQIGMPAKFLRAVALHGTTQMANPRNDRACLLSLLLRSTGNCAEEGLLPALRTWEVYSPTPGAMEGHGLGNRAVTPATSGFRRRAKTRFGCSQKWGYSL